MLCEKKKKKLKSNQKPLINKKNSNNKVETHSICYCLDIHSFIAEVDLTKAEDMSSNLPGNLFLYLICTVLCCCWLDFMEYQTLMRLFNI